MNAMRHILKSKIHRATVTDANVEYEGSVTLDTDLMAAADLIEFERVQILSIDSGERLETYVIAGEAGSGQVCMNGAAARIIGIGETVIILAYTWLPDEQAKDFEPNRVLVGPDNRQL